MRRRPSQHMRWQLVTALLVVPLLWMALAGSAAAHPAPSVIHDYLLSMTEERLVVEAYLRVSPELVPEVYRTIDTDGDGRTSDVERDAWVHDHPAKLSVKLGGTPLTLEMGAIPTVSREDLLLSINRPIVIRYTAALPNRVDGKQRPQLSYGDNYLSYDEYYLSVTGDLAGDIRPRNISRPQYPATYQLVYQIPPVTHPSRQVRGELAPAPWSELLATDGTSLASSASAVDGQATAISDPGADQQASEGTDVIAGQGTGMVPSPYGSGIVLERLRDWRGEPWSALVMVLLALGIGALHALTPGHSKTIVAAYLVSSQGRIRDAVMLGGVVTFTHTFGVVTLGLILLLASNFSMPRTLQPALEALSGGLVVVLGLYLVVDRARRLWQLRSGGLGQPDDHHGEHGEHGHYHAPASASHQHDHVQGAYSCHHPAGHEHAEDSREHAHVGHGRHSHDDHEHGHGLFRHSHPHMVDVSSPRAVVSLGISGGLVPCPDALAILLLAVGVGQVGLGLGLVTSFSLGVAAVLVTIGVVMVTARDLLQGHTSARLPAPALWSHWVPLASAGVVVVVGALMMLSSLSGLGLAV